MSIPPAYNSQTTLHDTAPPPYSSTQAILQSDRSQLQPPAAAHPFKLAMPHNDQDAHNRTSSSSSHESSRKSRWQQLKQENEERKAKKQHVTHEQAARMVGHDEDWLNERDMGKGKENGWVKKGSGGCALM